MEKRKKEAKGEFISVRVSENVKKKIQTLADKQERSLSWMIGKIIEEYLSQKKDS